jgi:hypothetical protein
MVGGRLARVAERLAPVRHLYGTLGSRIDRSVCGRVLDADHELSPPMIVGRTERPERRP